MDNISTTLFGEWLETVGCLALQQASALMSKDWHNRLTGCRGFLISPFSNSSNQFEYEHCILSSTKGGALIAVQVSLCSRLYIPQCTMPATWCLTMRPIAFQQGPQSSKLNPKHRQGWLNSNHAPLLDLAHVLFHFNEGQTSFETFSADNKKKTFA